MEILSCKGLFFRHRISRFINKSSVCTEKVTFSPLKRLSCNSDCESCHGLLEMLNETILDENYPVSSESFATEEIVQLVAVNDGHSYEDTYDEWHLEFQSISNGV